MRPIILIIMIFLFSASAIAGGSSAGKSAYSFLKIGISAKSQAMAGAFVALADDLSSLSNNPAGLTAIVYDLRGSTDYYDDFGEDEENDLTPIVKDDKQNKFFATYMNYLLDFQTGYLGFARYLNDISSFGLSIQYQDYGTFTALDQSGNPTGTFSAYDMAFGLTYSKRFSRYFSVGVTTKFIVEKIENYSSDALALDLGVLYRFDGGRTSLGLSIMNLGTQLKGLTKTHKDPLPLVVDAGLSHTLKGLPLTVNTDITIPSDNDVYFAFGGQFESLAPFMLRFGWSSSGADFKTGSSKDKLGGFAGGFGYNYQNYSIDYSYSSYADLGNVHRVTLSTDF